MDRQRVTVGCGEVDPILQKFLRECVLPNDECGEGCENERRVEQGFWSVRFAIGPRDTHGETMGIARLNDLEVRRS